MKSLKLLLFILTVIIFNTSWSQSTPQEMVVKMGRGINLGNVLSAPIEGNWAPPVEETYFQDIANIGFENVRIPIRFDNQTTAIAVVTYTDSFGNYIGSPSDYTVNSIYLDRIEEVISWALDKNLVAIIDVHGDHWFWESFDSSSSEYKTGNDRLAVIDRFKAIWTAISNRFQNTSEDLLFEIMNEAYFSMSASEVDTINTIILSIIRQTNPTRNVIVNGGGSSSWEAPLQMSTTFINSDNYLIATFHYYIPFNFTASSRQEYNVFNWGTAAEKAMIDSNFNSVHSWSQTNGIPVYVGEFGADNEGGYNYDTQTYGQYGGPTNTSRVAYHNYLATAAVDRGFSFAAWDAGHKSNKTIYNVSDRSWIVDVRNAILNVSTTYVYDGLWTPTNPSGISTSNDIINVISGNTSSSIDIISAATEANSLTISSGAKLVINTGASLTVENFDNQGILTIRSNSTKFGTLITNTIIDNGTIDYRRYVNANASSGGNDLISAPLHGQTFGDFAEYQSNENVIFNNPNNTSQKLFGPFDKISNTYLLYDTDTSDTNIALDAGIGFRAASEATSTNVLVFTGNLEIGMVNIPILDNGSQFSEWNLIGNPYTANVDFEAFFNANKTQLNTGAFQAIYGYNATANKWTIWNQLSIDDFTETEVFVPGQGFFVPSKPDNGMITFSPDMRRTGISDDFILNRSSTNSNIALAKLCMNTNSQEFNTDIYFMDGQTTGLDIGYDAGAFNGNANGLFTHLVTDNEGLEMAIQTLPFTNINDVIVALGLKATQGIQLSIGLDTTNSALPSGIDLYLEDSENSTWTLLNMNNYTFTPSTNITGIGRFFIHFQPETLSSSENELDQINIAVIDKIVYVRGLLEGATELYIHDVLGRKALHRDLDANGSINTISLSDLTSGIYLVHLKNKTHTKTQKVILN